MLNERSKQVRRDTITLSKANGGYHYGGTFSCTEILISLYDHVMDQDNDRFILSKGHGCWSYYVLLRELGYDPPLEGHPHRDTHNGVHWTTGSEGHGFPAGIGMALAKRMKDDTGHVYVVIGDENPHEDGGSSWQTRIYHNPLVPWIWLGGIVVMIGGVVSLSDRRHRIGSPRRSARQAPRDAKPATA